MAPFRDGDRMPADYDGPGFNDDGMFIDRDDGPAIWSSTQNLDAEMAAAMDYYSRVTQPAQTLLIWSIHFGMDPNEAADEWAAAYGVTPSEAKHRWFDLLNVTPLTGRLDDWEEFVQNAPPALVALCAKPKDRVQGARGTSRYGRRALEGEVGKILLAPEGTRNDQLNRSAFAIGQLVAGRALGVDEAYDALQLAALRCGLTATETAKTLDSGMASGMRTPRTAPR
jgi:hypothetical protein